MSLVCIALFIKEKLKKRKEKEKLLYANKNLNGEMNNISQDIYI